MRVTFPTCSQLRLVRVHGYSRVFAHTPSIFMQRGIADPVSLQMASLGAEPCEGASFIATAFEVPDDGSGMEAFREREEEYDLRMVPLNRSAPRKSMDKLCFACAQPTMPTSNDGDVSVLTHLHLARYEYHLELARCLRSSPMCSLFTSLRTSF